VNPEAESVRADLKTQPRIAIVQHGDYPAAYETYVSDRPEPYAGMKKTVGAIEDLIANREFLLISLDAAFKRSAHHSGHCCAYHRTNCRGLFHGELRPHGNAAAYWQKFDASPHAFADSDEWPIGD
jgi:hypothetical protein